MVSGKESGGCCGLPLRATEIRGDQGLASTTRWLVERCHPDQFQVSYQAEIQ